MSSENKYICPKCKSENIQKCSILYDVHKQEINLNGESQGTGYQTEGGFSQSNTKTNSQGSIKNSLLEKVSPPVKRNIDESKLKLPEQPFSIGGCGCSIYFLFWVFLIVKAVFFPNFVFEGEFGENLGWFIIIFIFVGGIFSIISICFPDEKQETWKKECDKIKKEKQKEIDKEYNKKYKEWEQKFFCNRCGHIFIIKDE